MSKREKKLRALSNSLPIGKELIEKYPEYYKKWLEVRRVNKTALSSQDFRFFVFIREAEKIHN